MIRSIQNVVLAAVALFMPLYIWRMYYPHSDWAILVFLPLAVLFFLGYLSLAAAIFRARWGLALVPNSPLARVLTGKVGATCRAIVFLLVSTILLAWQSLVSSFQEIVILVILCFVSSALFIFLQIRTREATEPAQPRAPPHDQPTRLTYSTITTALLPDRHVSGGYSSYALIQRVSFYIHDPPGSFAP